MKRFLSLFLAALFAFAPIARADLRAASTGSVVRMVARSAVPVVDVATGSMGNNGALTVGTALATAYASAYVILPASAISSGSAAGTYFMQCSTTTACTVFNNTYTSGIPTIPASPTAFATTGPGAFTGNTTLDIAITISIPAASMGANGDLRLTSISTATANANSHIVKHNFGGTDYLSINVAGAGTYMAQSMVMNRGVTNSQLGGPVNGGGAGGWGSASGGGNGASSVDSTAAINITFKVQKAVATDNMALEGFAIEALADGT